MHSSTRKLTAAAAVVVGFICTNTATARPPISIRTGANTAADGYLEVQPDEYGSVVANFSGNPFGPNADRFKPLGSTLTTPTFTHGFFLFAPGGQRELLSDNANWQATTNGATPPSPPFSADTSLNRAVTSPNVASDSNGDGINDTLNSSFRVFSPTPGTDLAFSLRQRVQGGGPAMATMTQDYTVTNNGTAPITINMVNAWDGDLLWDNNFETDSVGTNNAAGPGRTVFMQEPTNANQAIHLTIPTGRSYWGGKHGVDPDGASPGVPYDFGTDTEYWDANGLPPTWANHIAGVGYNTNGQSGPSPVGSTVPRDAFMGIDFALTLGPGQSQNFTVISTYGQIPEPATLSLVAASAALVLRRRRVA